MTTTTTIEKKSLRVGKYVDTNHVDTLVRTYKQERWAANSERLGKEDSLSVWYSVEEMEEFIKKAKQAGANGIRMHFGVYPEGFDNVTTGAGRQTIVLVANKQKHFEGGFGEKNVYINTENGPHILAYNFGTVCPNYCPIPQGESDSWGGIGTTLVDRGDKGMLIV
jgi:hypothetical protein